MWGLIIAVVLASLLLVWLSQQTGQSRRLRCERKQTLLFEAIEVQEQAYGKLPGWREWQNTGETVESVPPTDGSSRAMQSWCITLLPWIDRRLSLEEEMKQVPIDTKLRGPLGDIYDQWQQSAPSEGSESHRFLGEFVCPDDPRMEEAGDQRDSWLSYIANAGMPEQATVKADQSSQVLGIGVFLDYTLPASPRMTLDFIREHDGAAHTLLLSENIDAGLWSDLEEPQLTFLWNKPDTQPVILAINEQAGEGNGSVTFARPSSRHGGGVNVIFVAGNSQFLSDAIDSKVLQQLMTSDEAAVK